jgi:hypothetical protein
MASSTIPASDKPPYQRFGNGELVAAPALELLVMYPREQLVQLCNDLWVVIDAHQLLPVGEAADILTVSDAGNTRSNEILTPDRLTALRRDFVAAAGILIRRQPVTLLVAGRRGVDPTLAQANALRITVATAFFPDDPLIVSIAVTSTEPVAWARLAAVRDTLLERTGDRLLWTTLGYGFACHLHDVIDAGQQMELLCMRYLGVELQDLFGHYTLTTPYGLRSVNWQVCVGAAWLEQRLPEGAVALSRSAQPYKGSLFWQTGDRPSLCDRNDLADHDAIRQYLRLHDALRDLIFVPGVPWFPFWQVETTERWANRWNEVGL